MVDEGDRVVSIVGREGSGVVGGGVEPCEGKRVVGGLQ